MSTKHTHSVMRTIACHGRANIGNFEPELHDALSALITSGLIATEVDTGYQDTLWCHLTPAGYERLFDLNSLDQPTWTQVSWAQETETEVVN